MAKCATEDRELSSETRQWTIDRTPFRNFRISDAKKLDGIESRRLCKNCNKSRKYFCYTCCSPIIDEAYFPRVKLPIKIDIIKHRCEIAGKSTAVHAAILAPDDVTIYVYPKFPEILDKEQTIVIFPSETAMSIDSIFMRPEETNDAATRGWTALPIKKAIFIDSTWRQSKEIYKDKRLNQLRCVILKSRVSQFWRHQKNSPRWYLATIEAIHQFLVEMHTCAFGAIDNYADLDNSVLSDRKSTVINDKRKSEEQEMDQRYNGQYDDLLYLFKYMYDKIHTIYDHEQLLAYKRPLL